MNFKHCMTIKNVIDLDKLTMTQTQLLKGYFQFISADRGVMLFLIVMGSTFLASGAAVWSSAIYLGLITFCIWSAADAIDNICDVDIDVYSDPFRARFTRKIGKTGLYIAVAFTIASLVLGAAALNPWVFVFTALGLGLGIIYSVPPLRLRRTPLKPIVNSSVGAVPVAIVAAFYNFPPLMVSLVVLMGITIAVYSLWEDLADFGSDSNSGSRTVPIIMGFKPGLILTVALGYVIIGLMAFVGFMFSITTPIYYAVIIGVTVYITARLVQKRNLIVKKVEENETLYKLGEVLARDFELIAAVFTITLVISALLTVG